MEAPNGACGLILVVDDDAGCRALVREVVEDAGYDCVESADAEQALRLAREAAPTAAVVDVCLPGRSGYELCRRLRLEAGPALPVILLSGERTESYDRVAGLLLGADDYVVKPFAPDELTARIGALLRRTPPREDTHGLTRREREILGLLAEGLNEVEIAERLVISPTTVRTHIEHILPKLHVHSRAQAVAVAFRDGLAR